MMMNMRKNSFRTAILLLGLYLLLSLFHLGSRQAPSTFWETENTGEEILLDFGEEQEFGLLFYYLGNYEKRTFRVESGVQKQEQDTGLTDDPIQWKRIARYTMDRVYQWGKIPLNRKGQYLRLTLENNRAQLGELIVRDRKGKVLRPVNAAEFPELFDEETMFSGKFTWQEGTVFDESVFGRTAYEFLTGHPSYEDTHPPLGKILIAAGIAVFGMNPFGWRIAGVIAGFLLLILIWKFAELLLEDEWLAVGVLALLTLDFMHFTESRLAHVDSFLVLFMTGMYYFMYRYYRVIHGKTGEHPDMDHPASGEILERTCTGWKELFWSGCCMGCAIACKWSGCYGAAGLALVWLFIMGSGLKKRTISRQYCQRTVLVCVLCFIVIPILIYLVSYLPFRTADPSAGYWERLIQNQKDIFQYHISHNPFHKQGSRWYQWPLMIRPIRLGTVRFPDETGEFLILMGNPAFWWGGILLLFACLERFFEEKDGTTAFLLVGFLAPILPWVGIERSSFLYHYYPSLPFLALLMGLWAKKQGRRGKQVLGSICILSGILMVVFYPVISGTVVEEAYVTRILQWLPTWNFVG